MVTTANTQWDAQLVLLANTYGLSNNQVFDRLVMQAAQRLGGGPVGETANTAVPTGANGSVFTLAGNAPGTRLGIGTD